MALSSSAVTTGSWLPSYLPLAEASDCRASKPSPMSPHSPYGRSSHGNTRQLIHGRCIPSSRRASWRSAGEHRSGHNGTPATARFSAARRLELAGAARLMTPEVFSLPPTELLGLASNALTRGGYQPVGEGFPDWKTASTDRKSTRLNS